MTKPTTYTKDKTNTITFELTIGASVVAASYHNNLEKIATTIELKGFRKGKAPLDLVERSLDKSKVYSYVLEDVIPPSYLAYLKEHNLTPISEPRITPVSMLEGKDWTMKVEFATLPEFDLGDYQAVIKQALSAHAKSHKHQETEDKTHRDNHKLEVIFDALLKHISFEVSPLLVDAESKAALSRLVKELSSLNLKVADYAKSQKKSESELVAEYSKNAALRIRLELILEKLETSLGDKVKDRQGVLDFLLKL